MGEALFSEMLRGALEGSEPDEETYFAYSATLRIFGDISDLDDISIALRSMVA